MSTSLSHCRNCGHRLYAWDRFCSQCGQDTQDHPPTLWEFVYEWVLHYLAVEGKLWKSLWGLIVRPGFLTLEYLAGRKQRYVLPLRLVLTLGLLFFVAVKLMPGQEAAVEIDQTQALQEAAQAIRGAQGLAAPSAAASAIASAARPASPRAEALELDAAFEQHLPALLRGALQQGRERWRADPNAEARRIGGKMLAMAPYAVLLSLPFFAGLLKLLYWRQAYGTHFVFAMHLHAAWYAMLLLATLTPWALLHGLLWLWSNVYPLLALKRVHTASWAGTLLRGLLLAVLHWALILLVLGALLLLGLLSP
ncbi:MAG: DUF3667 domain-containing protein [Inhella sp.]